MPSLRDFALALAATALVACGGGRKQEDQPSPAPPDPDVPPGQVAPPPDEDAPPAEENPGAVEDASQARGERGPGMGMGRRCPSAVPGTEVTVEDTPGGIALVFINLDETAEVRRRVEEMAERHELRRVGGGPGGTNARGGPAGGGMGRGGGRGMVAHSARADEVEGGARLVLEPSASGDLDTLRAQVRDVAAMMQTGQCPGMAPADATDPEMLDGEPMLNGEPMLDDEEAPEATE